MGLANGLVGIWPESLSGGNSHSSTGAVDS